MPAMTLWDLVLGRKAGIDVMEDNDATIVIVKTGRTASMRHVSQRNPNGSMVGKGP
jgi:hypothetical protein